MSKVRRLASYIFGIKPDTKQLLAIASAYLSKKDYKALEKSARAKESGLHARTLVLPDSKILYPHIRGKMDSLNEKLQEKVYREAFEKYAPHAFDHVSEELAKHILEMNDVKKAATLQLFAKERLHILLLGDPGTGKTDILRESAELAEHSVIGLGSGTSGAGLSAAYVKGGLEKGLLPLADKGICCIDELNLMKKDDRAALYNAMEKGKISIDKGGKHEEFSADVRVLATANPKGDQFVGETAAELRKQLPFDPALLSRFHLTFLIRKPDTEQFVKIAQKIGRAEKQTKEYHEFIRAYVTYARKKSATFPKGLEPLVTDAAKKIKEAEDDLLIEVSPRLVKGIIGFAKASAICELRKEVDKYDVERVLDILGTSLGLKL